MPDLFKAWQQPSIISTEEIIKQYCRGFAGAMYNPEAREEFRDGIAIKTGEEVCHSFGYQESAKGKLLLPSLLVMRQYPDCFPGGGQLTGDCVAWGQRNANLQTMVGEVLAGVPDPVSGHLEGFPEVSVLAIKNGVFAPEAMWPFRKHKPADGWDCASAARVSQTKAAMVLRKDYPGFINLEKYTRETVTAYDRKNVPSELVNIWDDNLIREATEVKEFEAVRDLMDRGFGITSCGSESFSDRRDENGVCKRTSEGWAHAMAFGGCDDRPWAYQTYGGPLILLLNSWNEYMTGSRKINGTDLEIPRGSMWVRWKDIYRRYIIAMAGAAGWIRKQLPDLSPGW